jgi:hypothetical protein
LRRLLILLLVFCAVAVGFTACNRYGDDIDSVKTADTVIPGKTNEVLVIDIAGARGTVEWQAGPAPQYQSDDIVGVTAVIKRVSATGIRHQIDLDFIHNRQTQKVAFDGAVVDGKKQDLISSAFNLFMMQLE